MQWLQRILPDSAKHGGLSINNIHFDLTGWTFNEGDERQLVWNDAEGDALLVSLTAPEPTWPDLRDPIAYRSFCRDVAAKQGCGLLSADVVRVASQEALAFLYKRDRQPGYSYTGFLILNRGRKDSIVVCVSAREQGTTGTRDAVVTATLGAAGELEYEWESERDENAGGRVGRIKGWLQDPYDPSYTGLITRNLADDEKYDALVPWHPLTKVRRMLRSIASSLSIDP